MQTLLLFFFRITFTRIIQNINEYATENIKHVFYNNTCISHNKTDHHFEILRKFHKTRVVTRVSDRIVWQIFFQYLRSERDLARCEEFCILVINKQNFDIFHRVF